MNYAGERLARYCTVCIRMMMFGGGDGVATKDGTCGSRLVPNAEVWLKMVGQKLEFCSSLEDRKA